jgi:hypothetical protein
MVFDIPFMSSEHAYMYQKSDDPDYRQLILQASTPKEARQVGMTASLRSDWDQYRNTAMLLALRAKISNEKERDMLLATGDAYLEETNYWNDIYWGVCKGVGKNMLGTMLMNIREEINVKRAC